MAKPNITDAIGSITLEILATLSIVDSESRHPGNNPDDSDDVISDGKARIAILRRIRQELEDLS